MSVEGRGKRPYKVWDSGRLVRKGLVAANFTELVERGRDKLELGVTRVRVVLEADGTQVEDPDYFHTLPENTVFLLLRQGEHWYPAGVEVLRQAITAIPKIVCETIYSLGLHDAAPVWKVMDQYGKITVVLSWDPCHRGGQSHKHGTLSSPRKATTRVIVSGIGESTTQRQELLAAAQQSSFGSTHSPLPGVKPPGGLPSYPVSVTTIHRDGKKETMINDVGSSIHHQASVISQDSEKSYLGGMSGILTRQGSSVDSAHSTTVHIHTPECCSYGHPTPAPMGRASPPGDQAECDFHCVSLHDGTGHIHTNSHYMHQQQASRPGVSSPIREPLEKISKSSHEPPHDISGKSSSGYVAQKSSAHVHFSPDFRPPGINERAQRDADSSESETENTTNEEEGQVSEKFLLLIDQPSSEQIAKKHLSIKDIGVILDRLSSKIIDVERLDRELEGGCFNWTIKATIKGDSLRELGVLYGGHYYTICEHPEYGGGKEEPEEDDKNGDEV